SQTEKTEHADHGTGNEVSAPGMGGWTVPPASGAGSDDSAGRSLLESFRVLGAGRRSLSGEVVRGGAGPCRASFAKREQRLDHLVRCLKALRRFLRHH